MSDNEERLRKAIRKQIQNEISTTGGVAGYLTPKAFTGDKHSNADQVKKQADAIGYSLTPQGEEDLRPGDRLSENYYEYRNDTSKLPHQKIGVAMAEINKQLATVEKVLQMNHKLKKEYGVSTDRLWKRTLRQMTRLEGKLLTLASKLREMRG